MKKWKRPLLFWTLAALFLIIAPVVVLNARGYRFDMNRGVFVYSGTITFKSNPQNVDVKLNNEPTDSKKLNRINNSYNLSGLLPKNYSLQISAEGYQPWSKKTDVHSGISSEFWNVLLVRNNYERIDNDTPGIDKFFTSSNGNFIAYTANSEQYFSVKIFNPISRETEISFDFPAWQFISDSKKENIEWSPDGNFISIPTERRSGSSLENLKPEAEVEYNYFIADLNAETSLNLNQLLDKDDISNVRWDPRQKGYLFFMSQNTLYRADISDAKNTTEIASGISSFDLSGNGVYYSALDNSLVFKNILSGKAQPVQITSTFPGPENVSVSRMMVYDDLRVALILENEDLYIFNKGEHNNYFKKLESPVREAHFSDDGKKLLFWSDNEISVYYLRDETSQPIRSENEKQSITRYSEPLDNVQWFDDYEHIIFTTGRWTKIIELDPRDYRNCMDLINTEIQNAFVVYSSRLERLYFTDVRGESASLFSIIFPEPTPFLGIAGL